MTSAWPEREPAPTTTAPSTPCNIDGWMMCGHEPLFHLIRVAKLTIAVSHVLTIHMFLHTHRVPYLPTYVVTFSIIYLHTYDTYALTYIFT